MKNLKITVNGVTYDVQVEEVGETTGVSSVPAVSAPAAAPAKVEKKPAVSGGTSVNAPMPGTILSVNVSEGQSVKKGDVLIVLEAMKMENEIKAPNDATVSSVAVQKGESVDTGAVLVTLS